jgi:hypothetical protein
LYLGIHMPPLFIKISKILSQDTLFWYATIIGSLSFVIQALLTLFGGSHDIEDHSIEADFSQLKLLSKQAITGFLMIFGLSGLACRKEFGLDIVPSIFLSILAGAVAVYLNALIFKGAKSLRSRGSVFKIEETIGKRATIYQKIPKNGVGKITISLNDLTHEIDAMSYEAKDLESFSSVEIIKKVDEKTVVVAPIK